MSASMRAASTFRLLGAGLGVFGFGTPPTAADDVGLHDTFDGDRLEAGWRWTRENPEAWRLRAGALEILIEPGNQWGPVNDARNVLWREVPAALRTSADVRVTVRNRPTAQWEQTDLVWYFDDGHMVKLGQEMVDGKVSIVMGREEGDRTRTIAVIPHPAESVELRLVVRGDRIHGSFRDAGGDDARPWKPAGGTDLPAAPDGKPPRVSVQCYQGSRESPHWTRIDDFHLGKAGEADTRDPGE